MYSTDFSLNSNYVKLVEFFLRLGNFRACTKKNCLQAPLSIMKYIFWNLLVQLTTCADLRTFTVPLDNFSPVSPDGKFEMRYLIDTSHFDSTNKCVLFVILGGEATMKNTTHMGYPFVSERLARKFQAAVVQTEHRFYGESKPISGDYMQRYLSVEQALEDYASLIAYLRSIVSCARKVVGVFGGSYPGALAALMRLRYPNLVDFAHASSAPLGFYGGRLGNKYDYYSIVTAEVARIDSTCPGMIRNALRAVKDISGVDVCDDATTSLEEIIQIVRAFFANQNMANYPPGKGGEVVARLCDHIRDRKDDVDRFHALIEFVAREQAKGRSCLDVRVERPTGSNRAICADHSGCGSGDDGRSWDYQACTELPHAIASNGESDMFPPMEFSKYILETYCLDRFGVTPNYSKLNMFWGIDRIDQLTSRILFVNGARDGWTASAVTNATHAILIPSGAHHSEMGAPREDDTRDMREARDRIEAIIGGYIHQVYEEFEMSDDELFTYETV